MSEPDEQNVPPERWPEWERWQADLLSEDDPDPVDRVNGVLKYRGNPLVKWLANRVNLNDMWMAYLDEEWDIFEFMQFYRDIGYTLDGFAEIWSERWRTYRKTGDR